MTGLLELAERCEQATGPDDRELEIAIFRTVGPVNEEHCRHWCRQVGRTDLTREHYITAWAPAYSQSLDAAKTVIPELALWEVEHKINIGLGELFETPEGEPERDFRAGVGMGDVPAHWEHGRSFATPALALCAAALRARASQETSQ